LRPQNKHSRIENLAVCGKHFSADSFKAGLLSERKKLLPNAVPSIFFLVLFKCLLKFKFLQLENLIVNSRKIRKGEFLMLLLMNPMPIHNIKVCHFNAYNYIDPYDVTKRDCGITVDLPHTLNVEAASVSVAVNDTVVTDPADNVVRSCS
jgi:hypothetical protein